MKRAKAAPLSVDGEAVAKALGVTRQRVQELLQRARGECSAPAAKRERVSVIASSMTPVDIHTVIRDRIDELGLTRTDLADRCQVMHPLSPDGWIQKISRLLGPAGAPRNGNVEAPTLAIVFAALGLEVAPIHRPADTLGDVLLRAMNRYGEKDRAP